MAGSDPTVVGPYQIVRPLGRGRHGDLYLAKDQILGRTFAIQFLPQLSAEVRARLDDDARRRARLQHPAIAPIFMVGEHEGRLHVGRFFVPGQTLEEIIAARTEVSVVRRVRWMTEVCAAMAYALRVERMRLSLEPSAIVISNAGTPILLDLGLAQIIDDALSHRAPSYLSPEQLRGWDSDYGSDIFVAGALLYELVTYERPFGAGTDAEIRARIADGQQTIRTDAMPPALGEIVTRALQTDPAARHQTFQELAMALDRTLRSLDDAESPDSLAPKAPGAPSSSRAHVGSARLARRRAELIQQHVTKSREALQRHDYDAAMEHAEQAVLFDPAGVTIDGRSFALQLRGKRGSRASGFTVTTIRAGPISRSPATRKTSNSNSTTTACSSIIAAMRWNNTRCPSRG